MKHNSSTPYLVLKLAASLFVILLLPTLVFAQNSNQPGKNAVYLPLILNKSSGSTPTPNFTPFPTPTPTPPDLHKLITVRVIRLEATSKDSCNAKMDFYSDLSLHDNDNVPVYVSEHYGVMEGNDIYPD